MKNDDQDEVRGAEALLALLDDFERLESTSSPRAGLKAAIDFLNRASDDVARLRRGRGAKS